MKCVFTVYNEAHLDRLRVWARSWSSNGWIPRLLTSRDLSNKTGGKAIESAIRKKGGGFFFEDNIINFSWQVGRKQTPIRTHGKKGWESADLVRFPDDVTEDQILQCGRETMFPPPC